MNFLNNENIYCCELIAGLDLRLTETALAVDNKEIFNLILRPEPSDFLVSIEKAYVQDAKVEVVCLSLE